MKEDADIEKAQRTIMLSACYWKTSNMPPLKAYLMALVTVFMSRSSDSRESADANLVIKDAIAWAMMAGPIHVDWGTYCAKSILPREFRQ